MTDDQWEQHASALEEPERELECTVCGYGPADYCTDAGVDLCVTCRRDYRLEHPRPLDWREWPEAAE